ncbi:MAG: hypothetical protein WCI72_05790 [archaeon]
MPRTFTHAVSLKRDVPKIIETETLGEDDKALGTQIQKFANTPIIFCSYLCDGYPLFYCSSHRPRLDFETDTKEVYALPCDTFEFLRSAHWLKGYEQFVFPTLEKLLERYPTSEEFKVDFQKFFRKQNPYKMYPNFPKNDAEIRFELDYCLEKNWVVGCNEIAFPKPFKIKNPLLITE